jgi:hypothetical protein
MPSLCQIKDKAVSPRPRVDDADIFKVSGIATSLRTSLVLVCGTYDKSLIDQWRLVSDSGLFEKQKKAVTNVMMAVGKDDEHWYTGAKRSGLHIQNGQRQLCGRR